MRKITTRIYERLQLNSIFKAQVGNENPYNFKSLYSGSFFFHEFGLNLCFLCIQIGLKTMFSLVKNQIFFVKFCAYKTYHIIPLGK